MNNNFLPNELYIEPRFSEVDMMKVVHHSKYIIWFEEARFKFLKNVLDISISELRELDLLMPVIECYSNYKKPVFWDMPVIIDTKLEISNKANFNFHYSVLAADNRKLCSVGRTMHVFIDHDFNLKLNTPELFRKRIFKVREEKSYAFA